MISIPRVIPFHDDELLASWLLRLAKENCFAELQPFLNAYVYPNETIAPTVQLKKDVRIPFEMFWRSLPHDVMDERTLFFKTSVFTGIAPFLTKEQRQRYINCAFRTSQHLEPLYPPPHDFIKGFIICPECASGELNQYGHFYLHRAHHMPGVSVCHIHGCPLGRISVQYRHLRNDCLPNYNLLEQPATDRNLEYAVFAKDFLDAEFDCDIDDVLDIVERKEIAKVAADMNTMGYAALTGRDVEAYYRSRNRKYASPQAYLAALLYIYKNTDKLQKDLTKNRNKTRTFDGYSLNAVYRNDLLLMRHECCGQTFCTSPYGFQIGWRCPDCDRATTLQEKYADLIDAVGNGEYEPITPFCGMNDDISLIHRKCGRQLTKRARAFIYEGTRCECNWRVDPQTAKKNVEQYDGFELLKYERTDRPITVKHSCGGTFSIYYAKFLGDPRCRVCHRKGHLQIRTTEDFRSDVFDLTGDEYSLVGEYNGPHSYLTIRHNVCGTEQKYRPYYFLDGGRCPRCSISISMEAFKAYVTELSMGRYAIEGKATSNLYEIRDTLSGKSIKMAKLKILQELQRPTPSPILPLEARNDSVDLKSIQDTTKRERKTIQLNSKKERATDRLISKAKQKTDRLGSKKERATDRLISKAKQKTDRLGSKKERATDRLISKAKQKTDRLGSKKERATDRLISEAKQEKDRLGNKKKRKTGYLSSEMEQAAGHLNRNEKRVTRRSDSKQKTVIDYLKNNSFYMVGEPIFMEDVTIKGMTSEEVQQTMSNLSREGKLIHLTTRVYGFPGQVYSAEMVITSRYLVRQGRHIGFLRGACFASRLGLETKDTPEWSIATNKESVKTPNRKLSLLGVPIHIKGVPVEITDDNYLVFSIMDFLVQYQQCTSSPFETVLEALQHYVRENNHGVMLPYSAFEPHIEAYKTANIRVMMRQRITALCEEGVPNGKNDL